MSQKLNKDGLDCVQKCSAALQTAVQIVDEAEAGKRAAEELIPSVVQRLAKRALASHQKEAAQLQLGSHRDTLEILGNVVDFYEDKLAEVKSEVATKRASEMGSPSDESDSGGPGGGIDKFANQPGRRRGYDDPMSESDRALFAGLGLTVQR